MSFSFLSNALATSTAFNGIYCFLFTENACSRHVQKILCSLACIFMHFSIRFQWICSLCSWKQPCSRKKSVITISYKSLNTFFMWEQHSSTIIYSSVPCCVLFCMLFCIALYTSGGYFSVRWAILLLPRPKMFDDKNSCRELSCQNLCWCWISPNWCKK